MKPRNTWTDGNAYDKAALKLANMFQENFKQFEVPPVSKLTSAQAMYHFISGYTAKVAGTEMGVTEPEATFSACFGAAFMVWHPSKYAELLSKRIEQNGTSVWLVNTGWSGGGYGEGERMSLKYTHSVWSIKKQGRRRISSTSIMRFISSR